MLRWSTLALALAAVPGLASADVGHGHGKGKFGQPGDPAAVTRTVEIEMTDNRYNHSRIDVRKGETVRFVIHNRGQLVHEFNIATPSLHTVHQAEMLEMMKAGGMSPTGMKHGMGTGHGQMGAMGHDDPNSVLLNPGESGELVWRFDDVPKDLEFACNVPGHYQAGMVGRFHMAHR